MLKPLHPALRLLSAQPQLVLEHVGVYIEWLSSEVSRASLRWRLRLILLVLAITSVGVAFVLTGVALMLAAALPTVSPTATWMLVAAPAFPLLVALACAVAIRSNPQDGIMDQLKLQISQDMSMFREASPH